MEKRIYHMIAQAMEKGKPSETENSLFFDLPGRMM